MQKKINITIDEDLLKEADEFAKRSFSNRSALISLSLSKYMEACKFQALLPEYLDTIKDLSRGAVLDDETKQQLDDMERAVRVFRQGSFVG